MKYFILTSYIFIFFALFSQDSKFFIHSESTFLSSNSAVQDIYTTYNYQTFSKNNKISTGILLLEKRLKWYFGFTTMNQHLTIKDRITHWNYIVGTYGGTGGNTKYDTVYQIYDDPLDLVSNSLNFGFCNEIFFNISKSSSKINHILGFKHEIYFYEIFRSEFLTSDYIPENNDVYTGTVTKPNAVELNSSSFIPNTNISLIYKVKFYPYSKVNLGIRISSGTNLYSEWDKFKKYAWLGLGLEVGFGKGPVFKKKSKIQPQ